MKKKLPMVILGVIGIVCAIYLLACESNGDENSNERSESIVVGESNVGGRSNGGLEEWMAPVDITGTWFSEAKEALLTDNEGNTLGKVIFREELELIQSDSTVSGTSTTIIISGSGENYANDVKGTYDADTGLLVFEFGTFSPVGWFSHGGTQHYFRFKSNNIMNKVTGDDRDIRLANERYTRR